MGLTEKNEEIYSNAFNGAYYKVFKKRVEKTLKMVEGEGSRALDIGCGDGYLSEAVKGNFSMQVFGVDIVDSHLVNLKRKGISSAKVDLNHAVLPFKSGSFDCVIAEEVLEHVFENEKLLQEIYRVMKKDACFICSVPNLAAWYNRFLLFFGYMPHFVESGVSRTYGTPYGLPMGHVKGFTKKSFVEMLNEHGFEVEELKGCAINVRHVAKTRFQRFGTRLVYYVERFFEGKPSLSTSLLAKARKK